MNNNHNNVLSEAKEWLDNADADISPWLELSEQEPPKDEMFWAWDNHLERVIKKMKWFEDIMDWGAEQEWSGDFNMWMMPVADAENIASPSMYEL